MPLQLPDSVLQGMGLMPQYPAAPGGPPPFDSGLAGAPPLDAGLNPDVQQAIGVPPPPPAGVPLSLPSAPPHQADPVPQPDFQIPLGAIAHPPAQQAQPPHARTMAPRPPSADQQLVTAQAKQEAADQASAGAIATGANADRDQAAAELSAYSAHDEALKRNEDSRKAFQEESAKVHAQKRAFADAALKEHDDYKVDPGKFEKDLGLGGHIRWGIAMVLSSVGQAMQRQGGPNPILQMLQDKIREDISAQVDRRAQLKDKVGRAEHALDKYDAYSQNRDAQINLLDAKADKWLGGQLMLAAAKYKDPQVVARAQKEYAGLLQSSSEKAEKSAQAAAGTEMQKKQLGATYAGLAQSERHFAATSAREERFHADAIDQQQQQRDLEASRLAKAGNEAQAKLVRERALGGETSPVTDANGKVTGYKTGLITMKDGTTWVPVGTETSVTKLQEQHNASLKLLGTVDEIRRLGPEWLSDTANVEKKQKLDELFGTAKLQAIAANNLGVPTGKDVELATGTLGTDDPTGFRDKLPGLNEARKTLIRDHNVQLATGGLDKPWAPVDPTTMPKAEPTQVERIATTLKAEPDDNPERARDKAFNTAYRTNGRDVAAAHVVAAQAAEFARAGKISPDQVQGIADLKAMALAGGPEGQSAIDALTDLIQTKDAEVKYRDRGVVQSVSRPWEKARTSDSPIRQLADEALKEIRAGGAPKPQPATITDPGLNYDPNGYNPQALINRFHAPIQPTLPPQPIASK